MKRYGQRLHRIEPTWAHCWKCGRGFCIINNDPRTPCVECGTPAEPESWKLFNEGKDRNGNFVEQVRRDTVALTDKAGA